MTGFEISTTFSPHSMPFLFIPAVTIRAAGCQSIFPDKIGSTAQFTHSIIQMAHCGNKIVFFFRKRKCRHITLLYLASTALYGFCIIFRCFFNRYLRIINGGDICAGIFLEKFPRISSSAASGAFEACPSLLPQAVSPKTSKIAAVTDIILFILYLPPVYRSMKEKNQSIISMYLLKVSNPTDS